MTAKNPNKRRLSRDPGYASRPIAAGRPAEWNVLRATKRDTPVAPVSGFYQERTFVDEAHGPAL